MVITPEKIVIFWNIIVFLIYGIDKWRAGNSKSRTSEFTLLLTACLLGGMGALFGMVVFNHKTSKPKFRYIVPILALATPYVYNLIMTYVVPPILRMIAAL